MAITLPYGLTGTLHGWQKRPTAGGLSAVKPPQDVKGGAWQPVGRGQKRHARVSAATRTRANNIILFLRMLRS
jgi:hypothetical protein